MNWKFLLVWEWSLFAFIWEGCSLDSFFLFLFLVLASTLGLRAFYAFLSLKFPDRIGLSSNGAIANCVVASDNMFDFIDFLVQLLNLCGFVLNGFFLVCNQFISSLFLFMNGNESLFVVLMQFLVEFYFVFHLLQFLEWDRLN